MWQAGLEQLWNPNGASTFLKIYVKRSLA